MLGSTGTRSSVPLDGSTTPQDSLRQQWWMYRNMDYNRCDIVQKKHNFFADGLGLSGIMEGSLHPINLLCGRSHRHGFNIQGKIVAEEDHTKLCLIYPNMRWKLSNQIQATIWIENMCSDLCYFCHHSPLSMNWLTTGCLIYGWISDNYGRYPTFLVSNVIVACSGIILPYCHDFHTFAAVRFIMGLNFTTFFTSIYVLGKEKQCLLSVGEGGANMTRS